MCIILVIRSERIVWLFLTSSMNPIVEFLTILFVSLCFLSSVFISQSVIFGIFYGEQLLADQQQQHTFLVLMVMSICTGIVGMTGLGFTIDYRHPDKLSIDLENGTVYFSD